MNSNTISLYLFAGFALGLPLWGMSVNDYPGGNAHECSGDCYERWKQETGGVVSVTQAKAAARAEATPEELGEQVYAGCVACHGSAGEGGIGPQLAGQSAASISGKLLKYRNGETLGQQSALMWSQASLLSDRDIDNIAAFIATLE